jgi:hypothetical protein
MDRIFDVTGRQNLRLTWEISRDVIVIGSLSLALWLSKDPILSVGMYVGLDFLFHIVWVVMVFKIANFAVGNLWQIGALFLGITSIAAATLWAVQLVLRPWQAFGFSSIIILVVEGFIFVKYLKGSRLR